MNTVAYYETVDNIEALRRALGRIREAQRIFSTYTQEQVDRIFLAAAAAANRERIPLAKLAAEETGMGRYGGQGHKKPLCLRVYI